MHADSLALCRIRPAFPDIFIGGRAIMTMAARPKENGFRAEAICSAPLKGILSKGGLDYARFRTE